MIISFWLVGFFAVAVQSKIHHLSLTGDYRRNILLTSFGYDTNGTLDFYLNNFSVPDELKQGGLRGEKDFNIVGFTLSPDRTIVDNMRSKPHECQLMQQNQGYDAIFLVFNFSKDTSRIDIIRSGKLHDLRLCPNISSCALQSLPNSNNGGEDAADGKANDEKSGGMIQNGKKLLKSIFQLSSSENAVPYKDFIPLNETEGSYSTSIAVRFNETQKGKYYLVFHNCYNYRAHAFSERMAVHLTMNITEKNINSYLSAGDVAKPQFYLYMAALFAFAAGLWIYSICSSSSSIVYRVHHLMTALVILKSLSLFFHGINYYFVSLYGHQREVWAVVFYITHLLKGALLFGTIILIGTGYTFFKNFLSDRDRKLVMFVLPLQVIDNIAMVIIEESEFAEQSYQFWFQIFIFIDVICCMAIILPIVWSMRHLQEGARSDGKAAFNLEKLVLFRHFYLIVISYIYLTRVIKFLVEYVVPFNYDWISDAVVEVSTLFFFVITGHKFRPQERNPYLKLAQDADGEALTQSGVFASVTRVKRIQPRDELSDIPGGIGGTGMESDDSDNDDIFPDSETKPLTRLSSVV